MKIAVIGTGYVGLITGTCLAESVKKLPGNKIDHTVNKYNTLKETDAQLIVTEWPVFRTPDFDFMKEKLKAPAIFDGRNLYDLDRMKDYRFYYNSIGRKTVNI